MKFGTGTRKDFRIDCIEFKRLLENRWEDCRIGEKQDSIEL